MVTWRKIRRLELYRNAGVDGRFGATIGALAGGRKGADTWFCVVIEAELVLPVAIGNPDVNEVRLLRACEGLAGVESQTDRFAVQFGLAGGAEASDTGPGQRSVRVTLRSVPASATADGEVLHVFRQEAEIHVVVDFHRPGGLEIGVSVGDASHAGNPSRKQTALVERVVVDFLVGQGRDVDIALVGKVEGELQTGDEVALGGRKKGVFCPGIGTDLERNVMQRPHGEGLGVEDFVPAERAADQAVEFGRASATRRSAKDGSG